MPANSEQFGLCLLESGSNTFPSSSLFKVHPSTGSMPPASSRAPLKLSLSNSLLVLLVCVLLIWFVELAPFTGKLLCVF